MPVRYPAPLRPGDRIAVTAPSSGVEPALQPRLRFAVRTLEEQGYEVVLGDCLGEGDGTVSAPAQQRADELTGLLLDPQVRVVLPPWGGELAVELLPLLDWDALARADLPWLVGFSDISTLLLPLTVRTGTATLHGQNLLDTPCAVPEPLLRWQQVASAAPGARLEQGPSRRHRRGPWTDYAQHPEATEQAVDTAGTWRLADPGAGPLRVSGRLLGGCLETVSVLAGTPWGDLPGFAAEHAPEGLLLYVEAAEDGALSVARHLWRLRLAGWFDVATALLVGRTSAPDAPGFTQEAAVRSALAGLDLPVVLDVDCGHVPPHLALVNGALTTLEVGDGPSRLTQHLVP